MANNADWANKDFYKVLGVAKDAEPAAIKKAYRKLARENHPDSKSRRPGRGGPLQAGRRGLRRRRRRREAQGVRRDALRCSPERARAVASAASRAASAGRPRADPAASTSPTSSATCSTGRRAQRRVRHPQPRAAPGQGRRRRDGDQPGLPGRGRRHHDQHAAALGRALPDLLRHRRQARHPAARLRHLRRRRHGGQLGRRRVLDERDLPRVPRPAAGVRRALPDLSRLGSRVLRAAPSRPGSRPASRTASASGSRARAQPARTVAPTATSWSPCTSRRTGSSVARATT